MHLKPWIVAGEAPRGFKQKLPRDIDTEVGGGVQDIEQQPDLLAGPAPKLDEQAVRLHAAGDILCVVVQDSRLRAGQIILREFTDNLEQFRAAPVIEEFWGNALGLLRESREYGLPQVVVSATGIIIELDRSGFHRSSASRIPMNCQRSRGKKKLR